MDEGYVLYLQGHCIKIQHRKSIHLRYGRDELFNNYWLEMKIGSIMVDKKV